MCSKQVWENANFSDSTALAGYWYSFSFKRSSFLITSMIKDFNPGWFGLSFTAKHGKTPWKTDTRREVTLWVWQFTYQQHSTGSLCTSWTFLSSSFLPWIKITEHIGERKGDGSGNEPCWSHKLAASRTCWYFNKLSQVPRCQLAGTLFYSLFLNKTGTFSYLTTWKWLDTLNPSFITLHVFLPVMPKLSPVSTLLWSSAVPKYKGIIYSSILIIMACVYIMLFIAKTPKAICSWLDRDYSCKHF